jgi:hypothetical protein
MKIKNMYTIIFLLPVIFFPASCENDGFYYRDEARVRLEAPYEWALGTDSLEYSFVVVPEAVTEFELPVRVILMGKISSADRTVNIVVDEKLSTAAEKHYQLPAQVVLPENEFETTFRVVLKRTPDLQDKGVRLYIRIIESTDFKTGVQEQNHLLLKWNDILSRPANWDSLEEFFGAFSIVKYRFILNNTGVSDFNTQTMSWAQLMNYKIILRNALDEYNATHPGEPLRDENGQYITF